MRYRVHYLDQNERRTTQVDAASPQEAVIKFRHTRCERASAPADGSKVLSVSPAPESEELPW